MRAGARMVRAGPDAAGEGRRGRVLKMGRARAIMERSAMDISDTRPSLLKRVRDPRDAEAWRQFEGRYGELVLAYCRARGLQPCDAEDVRQLVMAKLVSS